MESSDFRIAAVPETGKPFPARIGLAMKRHTKTMAFFRWGMVLFYLFLLFLPFIFSGQPEKTAFRESLQSLSLFVFWGLGWPLIVLSTLIFGRFWCGILCPDGTLTESISRYGKNRAIPRWIRWPGWPLLTLTLYTLAFVLLGVESCHLSTCFLLGSLTLASLFAGFLYGKGRRVWCMYLCPSNAIFIFLAKIACLHFRVDRKKWDAANTPAERINCAPLINIRQMQSMSACHACGQCSGYRDAVELAARTPAEEILSDVAPRPAFWQTVTLFFGLTGICTASLRFNDGARFFGKLLPAAVGNGIHTLPLAKALSVLGIGLLMGLFLSAMMWLSGKIACPADNPWRQISPGIIPLAGTGLFSGVAAQLLSFFQGAGFPGQAAFFLRQGILVAGVLFSLWLGWRLVSKNSPRRRILAFIPYSAAISALGSLWLLRIQA